VKAAKYLYLTETHLGALPDYPDAGRALHRLYLVLMTGSAEDARLKLNFVDMAPVPSVDICNVFGA
jgi:hypothetical protein